MGVAILHFSSKSFRGDLLVANSFVETSHGYNYAFPGGFNEGSQFLVETPHGQNYFLSEASFLTIVASPENSEYKGELFEGDFFSKKCLF